MLCLRSCAGVTGRPVIVDFSVLVLVASVERGTRVPNVVTGERRYRLPYAGIGL